MSRGYIAHKQVHGSSLGEFHQDLRLPGGLSMLGTAEPTNPFGAGESQIAFDSMNMSGATFVLPVPEGATGFPSFFALVKEDPLAPLPAMMSLTFQIDWSYQASPWTTPGTGSTQTLITDGSGTGSGQFRQPGGSVPPGLRAVSGSVISNNTVPGSTPILGGAGVDIAIVEGGYLARITEGVAVTEAWTDTADVAAEIASVGDSWSHDITKAISEGVGVSDSWLHELNPVADIEDEDLFLAESVGVSDRWTLVKNP